MPRSRRYSSSDSSSSEGDRDDRRSRRSRSRGAPPSRRTKERAYRSMGKRNRNWDDWPLRYAEGGTSSDGDSGTSSSSGYSSDSPRRSRRAPPDEEPLPPAQQQTKSTLVLFGGVAVAILLVLLGGFALYKYFGQGSATIGTSNAAATAGGKAVTVTKTLSGGGVTTTVLTQAPSSTGSSASGGNSSAGKTPSTSGGNSTSSAGGSGFTTQPGLARNNIGIGFLPDYKNQNMVKINQGLGIKSSFYGWYAQLPASGDWDGSQLLSQLDDVKACNCIFQPAVMPTKGWAGLTKEDNSQALAIAKVMKKFTDEGIEVWLRFAHEINWYLSDGTYQGSVDDFKPAWAAVAAAVADNPLVKMFFTPNVAGSFSDYEKFFPDDLSTVHYLGSFTWAGLARMLTRLPLDFYPRSASEGFLEHVQPMYDKWCADGSIKFAMGETGNGWGATMDERLAWLEELTSEATAKAMPHYVGISWFNYNKEQVFYLYDADTPATNEAMKSWLADKGTTAEGAAMGNA